MVLETFIRKMMEKYLSDILDGVDHQAVSLQLLKGEVTLDDVKIKPSFLKSLALPFPFPLAFHRAIVHHLQLAINWKLLTSQPLLVKVEGIHLWAEAKAYDSLIGADSAYVQHVLAKAIQDKLDKLQRDEEVRLALAEADDVEGFKKPSSILARLIAIVTTSLQLEINDLHVCISAPGVDEHPGLHMGLALEHFKFETADTSSWASVPFKLLTGPTYKSLTVKNLSLYLNPDGRANVIAKEEEPDADRLQDGTKQQIKNMPSLPTEALPSPQIATAAEVAASINQRRRLPSGEMESARYQFLLKPTSLTLNLTFNKNIIPTVEVHAVLDMPQFQLVATRPQVLTLLHMYEVVSTRTEQVKKWIDKQPPKPAMSEFQQKRYMYLYKRTLNALWLPELNEAEMKEKEEMERELPYEELSLMRRASTLELKKELGEREKIGDREQAIQARTHWWDKLFRTEESTKKSIENSAEPEHQLTDQQKDGILKKVRKEGTDEDVLDEADAFKLEDLLAALTFHVSAEVNVGEIGLELWQERQKVNDVIKTQTQERVEPKAGESILAVAAREQRKRDDVDEPTAEKNQRKNDGTVHYEGEAMAPVDLRPLIRLQINRTTIGMEVEPDGDVQMDVGVDSIQFLDLTLYNARDPWTAGIIPQDVRVEFGYIGPVVPQGPKTLTLQQSVVVNEAKPYTQQHVASPPSVPVGVVLRLRRSKDTMNSEQRSQHLHSKAQKRDTEAQSQNADNASQQRKDRSVTDILFGTDPAKDEDKDSSAHGEPSGKANQNQQQGQGRAISPPAIFAHSVPVRTSTDVQVNNLRISYTDSLLEAYDFIKKPPSAFSESEKERMEKGEDVMVIDSAQGDADNMEQRAGGEIRHNQQQVLDVADHSQQKQHQSNIDNIAQPGVKGVVETGGEKDQDKENAKNKKDRLEKEKAAVGEDVRIVPGQHDTQQSDQSAAGSAGSQVEGSANQQSVGETKEDEIKKPLDKTLPQILTFFSPMLVRLHVPSPYISVIPDTAAKQLQRLTFSLNANARALLDADKDSIFARADVTNTRAWVARTEPVHAISLAPFHPPTSDSNYIIKPFNIGLSLERYPSPLTQLVTQKQASGADVVKEFGREVGDESVGMDAEDVVNVFEGQDGSNVYHMDADVDISAIHMKLAAKMWYMLQPLIQRVTKKGKVEQ